MFYVFLIFISQNVFISDVLCGRIFQQKPDHGLDRPTQECSVDVLSVFLCAQGKDYVFLFLYFVCLFQTLAHNSREAPWTRTITERLEYLLPTTPYTHVLNNFVRSSTQIRALFRGGGALGLPAPPLRGPPAPWH